MKIDAFFHFPLWLESETNARSSDRVQLSWVKLSQCDDVNAALERWLWVWNCPSGAAAVNEHKTTFSYNTRSSNVTLFYTALSRIRHLSATVSVVAEAPRDALSQLYEKPPL